MKPGTPLDLNTRSESEPIAAASALLLTVDEVAGLLRLDARTVAELVRSNVLRTIAIGGVVRIPRSSVDQLIAGLLRRDGPPDGRLDK